MADNTVTLVGNLTRDPELRHTPSGTAVCSLRLAVNTRRKDGATGEWTEKPNYFDVTVWGNQGENCAQYLAKGRPVAIDGRLEWREWEAQDGTKRQAVEIIADTVQFLGGRDGGDTGGGAGEDEAVTEAAVQIDRQTDVGQPAVAPHEIGRCVELADVVSVVARDAPMPFAGFRRDNDEIDSGGLHAAVHQRTGDLVIAAGERETQVG